MIKKCNINKELKIGQKIELEHHVSLKRARKIAMDHLKEFPCYYTKGLLPMERKLKRMQRKR
jgi:hypothetical protein